MNTRSEMQKGFCNKHGRGWWVESVPSGNGYCQKCAIEEYDSAPTCSCGSKQGFHWGTGDCSNERDPDISDSWW